MKNIQKVQALNPDKFNQINTIAKGVANGFQAAQGAMALFGAESEDVQKALLKVQGAMALAQGLEGLGEAGKQLKTLGERGIEAFQKMTTASKTFMLTGVGLLITALGTVIEYWDDIAVSLGFAKSEMEKMNAAMKVAEGLTRQQAADLQYYNKIVQDTKKSETERKGALDKLWIEKELSDYSLINPPGECVTPPAAVVVPDCPAATVVACSPPTDVSGTGDFT